MAYAEQGGDCGGAGRCEPRLLSNTTCLIGCVAIGSFFSLRCDTVYKVVPA